MDDLFWEEIRSMFKKEFKSKNDTEIKEMVDNMKVCLEPKNNHLLTILSSNNFNTEIEAAVLNALLQAVKLEKPKDEESAKTVTKFNKYQSQLKLSLKWNRVDLAQKFIFTDDLKDRVN